jgi:hypothetical protein
MTLQMICVLFYDAVNILIIYTVQLIWMADNPDENIKNYVYNWAHTLKEIFR